MIIDNFKKITEEIKDKVRNLAQEEESLKSISFSIIEEKSEFVIYFTWKKENYNIYNKERMIFRNVIKNICKSYYFFFNIQKSTSSKFIFNKIDIPDNIYLSKNI